jgi:predicted histone-like DNA-binding protein
MSVLYNKVERGNPQDLSAPKKWYPTLKTISQVSEKDVAKLIADETTLNRKEAEMSIDQLEKILIRLLLDSYSVQLGDWGSFHLSCNGEGSDTKEGVTAGSIKNINIRFIPGKNLKNAFKNASFVSAESLSSGK